MRGLLASLRFRELLGLFLLGLACLSMVCGLLLMLGAPADRGGGLLYWSQQAFLGIAGLAGPDLTEAGGDLTWEVGRSITGVVALLWPAIVLGVIVFRLFVHTDMFVIRERLSILRNPDAFDDSGDYLALRLYNTSPLEPVEVHFEIRLQSFFRHRTAGGTRANHPVEVRNPNWPVAERHVPYTLYVPLHDGDLTADGSALHAIQGHRISAHAELLLYITGAASALGTTTNELHRLPINPSTVSFAGFSGVEVGYDGRSWEWEGWPAFDDPSE